MTDAAGAEFIVLCEDLQAQVFVRRTLIALGAQPRRIRLLGFSSGSGADHVVKHYSKEVAAFRARSARARTALVVHVDGDTWKPSRHRQLADALAEAGQQARAPNERIAELVPCRNIETWIHVLDPSLDPSLQRPLNEEAEYPRLDRQSACWDAAGRFARLTEEEAPLSSLRDGVIELRRLRDA